MKKRSISTVMTFSASLLAILMMTTTPLVAEQKASGRVCISYVTNPTGAGYYPISIGQAQIVAQKSNINLSVLRSLHHQRADGKLQ